MSHIETFTLTLPHPPAPLRPGIEAALKAAGIEAIRWAVTAASPETLTIEGAQLCSPSST